MRLGYEDAVAKAGGSQPVGVHIFEDLAAALAALVEAADLHHLACRTDSDVAVGAVVGAGDDLDGVEGADLPQTSHGRASGPQGPAGVEDQPDFARAGGNRRLVHKAEEAAFAVQRLAL